MSKSRLKRIFSSSFLGSENSKLVQSMGCYRERRPLIPIPFKSNNYQINTQIFINGYVELEGLYIGELKNISYTIDISSKQLMLRTLDEAKSNKLLPWLHEGTTDIILCLSAHSIKILDRNTEVLIKRFSPHEVCDVSYVQDGVQHFVIMKLYLPSNDTTTRSLIIVQYCQRKSAEQTMHILKQLFEFVFEECTSHMLTGYNESNVFDIYSSNPALNSRRSSRVNLGSRLFSVYSSDLALADVSVSPSNSLRSPFSFQRNSSYRHLATNSFDQRRRASYHAEHYSNRSKDCSILIQNTLNPEEIKIFWNVIHNYRTSGNIDYLCNELKPILSEHQCLLKPLIQFIPALQCLDDMSNSLSTSMVSTSSDATSAQMNKHPLSASAIEHNEKHNAVIRTRHCSNYSVISQDSARGASNISSTSSQLSTGPIQILEKDNTIPEELLQLDRDLDEYLKE